MRREDDPLAVPVSEYDLHLPGHSSGHLSDSGKISRGTQLPPGLTRYYFTVVMGYGHRGTCLSGNGIYVFPWREGGMLEFVRDPVVRARDFKYITGPRDLWLASTAAWCIRRLHAYH